MIKKKIRKEEEESEDGEARNEGKKMLEHFRKIREKK